MTNVLVVDDHALVRRNIRSLLADETGWDLREAENGKVAVELSQKQRPDVVVLDLVMPVMNGMEAAYEIKKIAPRAKIVFISSHYSPNQTSALTRLFGADFVQKSDVAKQPFARSLVLAARALEAHSMYTLAPRGKRRTKLGVLT